MAAAVEHLERALEALEQGLDEAAHAHLLEAWDEAPGPALEQVLLKVAERLGQGVLPLNDADLLFELERQDSARYVAQLARRLAAASGYGRDERRFVAFCYRRAREPLLAMPLLHLCDLMNELCVVDRKQAYDAVAKLSSPAALEALRQRRDLHPLVLERVEKALRWMAEHAEPVELLGRIEDRLRAKEAQPRDQASLLEGVYLAPDDDAPRLVLSDWLQEQGDPLGEFIALQVGAREGEASEREVALREQNRFRWCLPLGEVPVSGVRFERGFPAGLAVSLERASVSASTIAVPPSLFERAPSAAWNTVRRLEVELGARNELPPGFSAWIGGLDWLRELRAPAHVLRALAHDDPAPRRLRRIEMTSPSLSGLVVLAEAPFGRRARELEAASGGSWRAAFRHADQDSPWLVRLELLSVSPTLVEAMRTLTELADGASVSEVKIASARLSVLQQEQLEARLARFPRWSLDPLPKDSD